MKTFKYLLFLLLIILVGFLIYVAVQPSAYNVKRTKLINAPADIIYKNIIDLKQWEEWGPWHDEDSTIVSTYSGKTVGVGATSSWTSKDGPGNMKLFNAVPNKAIDLKLQFGDYEPSEINWTLEEVEGGTNVTWGMKNDNNPFMFKIFGALAGGMDNMLGPMEESGLNNLENVVNQQIKNMPKASFKLGDIVEVEMPAYKFIGFKQNTSTDLEHEKMSDLFMKFMPKAGAHAASKLSYEDFIPGTVYTKWDETTKEAEFYIGVLLKKDLEPANGMTAINLAGGKAIKMAKFGNYGSGDYEAHTALGEYLQENNLKQNGTVIWELYVNDPTTVKPEAIQTDIYYPIQ
ncbi:MAG: GyrI-like domain-containing protein [Oceanihabitans sp.]